MIDPENPRHVFLVGHCMPDEWMLRSAVKRAIPRAAIDKVHHEGKLAEHAGPDSLLLVNRVLDGAFDDADGIELIRRLAAADDAPAMLLVSDIEDAQKKAAALGARPGFGKTQLNDAITTERIHAAATT